MSVEAPRLHAMKYHTMNIPITASGNPISA
jgi:hypothetical protein